MCNLLTVECSMVSSDHHFAQPSPSRPSVSTLPLRPRQAILFHANAMKSTKALAWIFVTFNIFSATFSWKYHELPLILSLLDCHFSEGSLIPFDFSHDLHMPLSCSNRIRFASFSFRSSDTRPLWGRPRQSASATAPAQNTRGRPKNGNWWRCHEVSFQDVEMTSNSSKHTYKLERFSYF